MLLAIGAGVFFVGWIQLSLAPDTYGVIFTRSKGFEKSVVESRGLTWRWEKLIPGALTIYAFPLSAQNVEIPVTGMLPSGEAYAALAPEKPDFTFEIDLSVSYRLRPEVLPALADTSRLRPDGLSDLYGRLERELSAKVSALVREQTAAEPSGPEAAPGDAVASISERISTELPRTFSHLEFLSLATNVVRVPDAALYRSLRETYFRVSKAREDSLASSAARLAAKEAEMDAAEKKHGRTIAVLEKYGELLDKHPSLVKFLFIASMKNFSALDLQSLDMLDKLDGLE